MSNVERQRNVGHIEIVVTHEQRLFIVDARKDSSSANKELTDEYRNRQIDSQLMDEVERRVRGTYPFEDESLLAFLKSDRKT